MTMKEILAQTSELTEDKAWFLGFTAGDGNLTFDLISRCYRLNLACGWDEDLARECARLLKSIYGLDSTVTKTVRPPPRTYCWIVEAWSKQLVLDLFSVAAFGRTEWTIPNAVRSGPDRVKACWLAGLADADGSAYHNPDNAKRAVSIASVNQTGLMEAGQILQSLGIENHYYCYDREVENWSPQASLVVSHREGLETFSERIPLRCRRKATALAGALASYQRDVLRSKDVDRLEPLVENLLKEKIPYEDIASQLEITKDQVRQIVRGRDLGGYGRGHGKRHQEIEKLIPEARRLVEEEGCSIPEAAARVGLEGEALAGAFRRRGIKVGKRRGHHTRKAAYFEAARGDIETRLDRLCQEVGHGLTPLYLSNLIRKWRYDNRKDEEGA